MDDEYILCLQSKYGALGPGFPIQVEGAEYECKADNQSEEELWCIMDDCQYFDAAFLNEIFLEFALKHTVKKAEVRSVHRREKEKKEDANIHAARERGHKFQGRAR